jgi:hypothetical protein
MSGSDDLPENFSSAENPAFLFPPLISVKRLEIRMETSKLISETIFGFSNEEAESLIVY